MSLRHAKALAWEHRLKRLFDKVDDYLEDVYGSEYSLHPARPTRGATANKESDGLFNIGASFTAGFGSRFGKGYVIDVRIATLEHIPREARERIFESAITRVRELLPRYFPGRRLTVEKDGTIFKITGDMSLGIL